MGCEYFQQDAQISIPSLFLVEFCAAVVRQTNSQSRAYEGLSRIQRDPVFSIAEVDRHLIEVSVETAIQCQLRGADTVYVALTRMLQSPLVSRDNEHLRRAATVVDVMTPIHAMARLS